MNRRRSLLEFLLWAPLLPICHGCFYSIPSSRTGAAPRPNSAATKDETPNSNPQDTLETLATKLASNEFRNVILLHGAGCSVAAGIPDFRTPGTGLYSRLKEYGLPYPEAIFELEYFQNNPQPFLQVAQEIWPGQDQGPKPTYTHAFGTLLERRGVLRRIYTQNIDGLEALAGVSPETLVECHGHFRTCSCTSSHCRAQVDSQICLDAYRQGKALSCPTCQQALVKPDVVFFGEEMPPIFMDKIDDDMDACDLLVVLGTSLLVAPVATIPRWIGPTVPRLLINRELAGVFFKREPRNVVELGDCDDGVQKLCQLIGEDWIKELEEIHAQNIAGGGP